MIRVTLLCFFLLQSVLFSVAPAHADRYQISIYSQEMGTLIQAKNCINLNFCVDTESMYMNHDRDHLRFHVLVDLSPARLKWALDRCALNQLGTKLIVENKTLNQVERILPSSSSREDFKSAYPSIYMKPLSEHEKHARFSILRKLYQQNRISDLYQLIPLLYDMPTRHYKISYDPNLDPDLAGAVTDHQLKTIHIGKIESASDLDLCTLVREVRHELDHAYQVSKSDYCGRVKKSHSWSGHLEREESAYFNDAANYAAFCPRELLSERVEDLKEIYERWYMNP